MAIDYSAGLSDDREYVFAEQPADPEMRESVNTWVWDDGTDYGMPRIGVEAVADQWETHDIQFNLAFANGRILNMFGSGKVHDPLGADGKPRILGAGPIEFELVKPFEHWKAHIQGDASVTSIEAQIGGAQPGSGTGEIVPVELEYRHPLCRAAVGERQSPRGGRTRARDPGGGRPHGWPALRAALPRQRHAARRRRRVRAQRRRPAHPARRGAPPRRVPRARVAVDRVPEWPRVRPLPLSAARRRQADVQRGLPLRGRRRADPGAGHRGAVAALARAQGPGRDGHARDRGRPHRDHPGRRPCCRRAW